GISRSGSPGGNNSGDIFIAFSTANKMPLPQFDGPWRTTISLNDELLDSVYMAAIQAIEEAVLNALFAATDMPTARPIGAICKAIDTEKLLKIMREKQASHPAN
ncbi:MAG: P1 family peptidase, partial [Hyphomicrobiales bacterium]